MTVFSPITASTSLVRTSTGDHKYTRPHRIQRPPSSIHHTLISSPHPQSSWATAAASSDSSRTTRVSTMQWGASEHPSHSNTQAEVGILKVQGPPVLHRETVLRKATWPHSYYSDPVGQSKCPWVTSSTTILSSGKWSSYLDLSCELTGQRMGGKA